VTAQSLWADRFDEIWVIDFEFRGAPAGEPHREGNRPHPVSLVAYEIRSGRTIRLFGKELPALPEPPYSIGERSLIVVYYGSADMGCHIALGWPCPVHILDLFAEFKNMLGGREAPAGTGLLGALAVHGLTGICQAKKDEMRDLVLRGGWSPDEIAEILLYNESDVLETRDLLLRMAAYVDLPRALLPRGRYTWAVAAMEWIGVPTDVAALNKLQQNWDQIKLQLIAEIDEQYHVYDGTHFRFDWFADYLERIGLLASWPRTEHGQLAIDSKTFEGFAKAFPELQNLKQLKNALDKLKLNDIQVGDDRRNRALLSMFRAKTGRNQPSNAKFLFASDTWLRSLVKPEPGMAIAYLDYEQQEFGIAAVRSGDRNMLEAYESGDPYITFGQLAHEIPPHINADNYKPKKPGYLTQNAGFSGNAGGEPVNYEGIRNRYKQCTLAVQYGMSEYGLAKRLAIPVIEARELMQRHREIFRRFWQWQANIVNMATFTLELPTGFGWTLNTAEVYQPRREGRERPSCSPRTIQNFLMQAGGAEMLQLACIYGIEAGIRICAPVHDAVLIEAPTDEIDQAVATMKECMTMASRNVLGGYELRVEDKIVRWPDRYVDDRGAAMWNTVARLVGINEPDTSKQENRSEPDQVPETRKVG
jgi:hypothetical protein